MKRNVITRFAVVLAVAASVAACSQTSSPLAPSPVQQRLPAPNGEFELRGTVSDSQGRLDSVAVTVSNGAYELSVLSDGNGEFVAEGLTAGEWDVTFHRGGYGDGLMRIMVAGDTTLECSLQAMEVQLARKTSARK
jgi:Carboxypeptidase regulatory-like domain